MWEKSLTAFIVHLVFRWGSVYPIILCVSAVDNSSGDVQFLGWVVVECQCVCGNESILNGMYWPFAHWQLGQTFVG